MFEMFETLNKALENAFVELFFPYIYNWIPGFTGWDHFLQHSKEVKELIFETIHEHKKTRIVGRPRVLYSYIYTVWTMVIRVVEFSSHENPHTQRKLLNFEFWINGELSNIGHHFSIK